MILGIDEVGRGPWAGPLVVGAVVLGGAQIDGLTDSKKLSKKRREILYDEIYAKADAVGLGWVAADELDSVGMSQALVIATRRAVEQIRVPYQEIIIDGTINFLKDTGKGKYVTTLAKADLLIPGVSAASIVAKVARDRYMTEQGALYPEYGFKNNSGYGVAAHRAAIDKLGVTPLHRLSFAPLQRYAKDSPAVNRNPAPAQVGAATVTTRQVGNESESIAASYLQDLGHVLRERNWRTKWCEIDIVSECDGTLYFTEVKHRAKDDTGDGIAAITPKKLKQMQFAAKLYAMKYPNHDLRLAVVATTGADTTVTQYLELL